MQAYEDMLMDWRHRYWTGVDLSHAEKFASSSAALLCQADAWRRLVRAKESPKYRIFGACCGGVYDEGTVKHVVEDLLALRRGCADCVDKSFTGAILDLMRLSPRLVFDVLYDVLTTTNASSSIVEKFHLLGQDTRHGKNVAGATTPRPLRR